MKLINWLRKIRIKPLDLVRAKVWLVQIYRNVFRLGSMLSVGWVAYHLQDAINELENRRDDYEKHILCTVSVNKNKGNWSLAVSSNISPHSEGRALIVRILRKAIDLQEGRTLKTKQTEKLWKEVEKAYKERKEHETN